MISVLPSDRGCDDTHRYDGVPVGPARGQADNTRGPLEVFKPIGSPCAAFHHGPEHRDASLRGRRYVCSLTRLPSSIRSRGRLCFENDPLVRPRTRFLEGGGYLTPPQKSPLRAIHRLFLESRRGARSVTQRAEEGRTNPGRRS